MQLCAYIIMIHYPTMFCLLLKGGPCGILAVVQAEIFKDLFFSNSTSEGPSYNSSRKNSSDSSTSSTLLPDHLLLQAVLRILQRAAGSKSSIDFVVSVAPTLPNVNDGESSSSNTVSMTSSSSLRVLSCDLNSLDEGSLFQALGTRLISHLKSSIGCILFLMSLILTR
jgi:hypothetical protein